MMQRQKDRVTKKVVPQHYEGNRMSTLWLPTMLAVIFSNDAARSGLINSTGDGKRIFTGPNAITDFPSLAVRLKPHPDTNCSLEGAVPQPVKPRPGKTDFRGQC